MEELISRIAGNVGIDAGTARSAVRIILSFLYQQGDRAKVAALAERLPGSESYIETSEDHASASLGGFSDLLGGGAMEVFGKLSSLGLSMAQIQGITQETLSFTRARAGEELVDDIIRSIPGLSQFL
jgi:hypothetical protein